MTSPPRYIGKPVRRLEDARFVTGRGQYVNDVQKPGVLHAAILRSPIAHGQLRSIDVTAARALPGVRAVITASELGASVPQIPMRTEPLPALSRFVQPVLARDKVRYVGEPIALIVGDTAAAAEDALGAVEIEIDALPAVHDTAQALVGETLLFEEHGTNHATTLTGTRGDIDAAFRSAEYVRRETFRVQRHTATPMEPRGVLADWDATTGKLTVYGAIKVPFAIRALLAQLLDLPEAAIDVIECDAGGGFGVRGEFYPEDFLVPFAARRLGRPVRWIEERREHFLASAHSREVDCELEIACTRSGVIVGLRGAARTDMGAYTRPNAVTAPRNLAQMIAGPYRVAATRMDVAMVLTNKTPAASYRGPGRFEADFFRERLIDMAAQDLGLDRVEMRRRNLVSSADMPYPLASVLPYRSSGEFDSGDHRTTLERCLTEISWAHKSGLNGTLVDGRYHGLGIGCYVEGGATGPKENARLVLEPDGGIAVYVGSSALGQGLETVCAQIAAETLGVAIERVRGVFHGSTGVVREGFGSHASRSTVMGGSAIIAAAAGLRRAIRRAAAEQFGCPESDVEIAEDLSAVRSGSRSRTVAELAPDGIAAEGSFENSKRTYSYGTHAAHVAVDPETGDLDLLDYVCVEDVGRIINPETLHGQVLGAVVQGLGGAILENIEYGADAQLLTASFSDYAVPTAKRFPRVKVISLEMYPSPNNPLGAKGAGEGGIIPVGGVIANAVAAALRPLGVEPCDLPLSAARLWTMIRRAARSTAGGGE
jgi:aerobic carbon-monoxide dehydrogenase large subunit